MSLLAMLIFYVHLDGPEKYVSLNLAAVDDRSLTVVQQCTFFTRGSMTFKEAYLRTGRILNVSVIPADQHSPTKLLNYVTAVRTKLGY